MGSNGKVIGHGVRVGPYRGMQSIVGQAELQWNPSIVATIGE